MASAIQAGVFFSGQEKGWLLHERTGESPVSCNNGMIPDGIERADVDGLVSSERR